MPPFCQADGDQDLNKELFFVKEIKKKKQNKK